MNDEVYQERALNSAKNKGFTLLEAVVALTIMAVIAGLLLSWLNTNLNRLGKMEIAEKRIATIKNIRAYMKTKNPMAEPAGSFEINKVSFQWHSEPLTEEMGTAVYQSGGELFSVRLYKTTVDVKPTDLPEYSFVIENLGYRRKALLDDY